MHQHALEEERVLRRIAGAERTVGFGFQSFPYLAAEAKSPVFREVNVLERVEKIRRVTAGWTIQIGIVLVVSQREIAGARQRRRCRLRRCGDGVAARSRAGGCADRRLRGWRRLAP